MFSIFSIEAQYFQFSQYNITPARTNVANVASDNYESANFIYRNQNTAGDFSINSSAVSYQRPFRKKGSGERWGGFGIDILDDRSALNGLLNKQRIALNWALNINTTKYQSLTLGISGRLKTQRFKLDKLTTGSQYVPGRGFVPVYPKNESINEVRTTTFGLNTSLLYQNVDVNNVRKNHFGISFFDLNEPRESILDNDKFRLPTTAILELGFRILNNETFHAYPNLLLTYSAGNVFVNTGVNWNLNLSKIGKLKSFKSISIITNYVLGSYAIAGFQLKKDKYTFGLSYDIGVGKTFVSNSGAVEVTFVWKNLVEIKPKKVKPVKQKKIKPIKRKKIKPIKEPKVKKEKSKKVKPEKVKKVKPIKEKNIRSKKISKAKKEKKEKKEKIKPVKTKSQQKRRKTNWKKRMNNLSLLLSQQIQLIDR